MANSAISWITMIVSFIMLAVILIIVIMTSINLGNDFNLLKSDIGGIDISKAKQDPAIGYQAALLLDDRIRLNKGATAVPLLDNRRLLDNIYIYGPNFISYLLDLPSIKYLNPDEISSLQRRLSQLLNGNYSLFDNYVPPDFPSYAGSYSSIISPVNS